jgi:large subunit ribosomal protein L21
MYAVIKAGGKQQRVKPGDVIEVELMHGQHGEEVTFTPLLVVDDDGKAHVGKDLRKATVKAKLVGEQKGDKVKIFKYRPKTGYKKTQGHRQMYTLVEIADVSLGRRSASKKTEASSRPAAEKETESAAAPVAEESPAVEEPTEAETVGAAEASSGEG